MEFGPNLRLLLRRLVYGDASIIVVASTGRSGSTMLFRSIAQSLVRHRLGLDPDRFLGRFLFKNSIGFVESITDTESSGFAVCKTHDLYDPDSTKCLKIVFIYGDPLLSAASVKKLVMSLGASWFEMHQRHLRASGKYADLFYKDVLNYEGQMFSWMLADCPNVYCVDYEDLWDRRRELSAFLGFELDLPARRQRETGCPNKLDYSVDLFERLRNLQANLKQTYESRRKLER